MTGGASELVERLGFAAAGAALVAALWLRRPPPCLLARWMAPEVRRAASDLAFRRQELLLRPGRQPLTLYLIRHGQSQANTAQERIVGGRDASSPLTSKGEAQAVAVGRRLAASGGRFDRVYASHAVRARRTAELACRELGLPAEAVRIEPRLVEFSQGGLERRPREEVYAEGGPVLRGIRRERMFYRPPGLSPDGERGESQHDVELRVRAFVDELQAAQAPEGPRTVALFSHGIAIRSFVRGVLGASAEFTVHAETDNCSLTVLKYRPGLADDGGLGGWVLKCFNA